MTKPIGPICNLDCKYCFYLEKERLYPGKHNWRMSPETLETYIRQYIEAQAVEEVSFAWQGGEPTLLGLDYFRRVVELQRRYGAGRPILNAFQTNGVLLDDEWCRFFRENGFLIGLSIDGPEAIHDFYRYDRGGKPSFTKVMRGLECLQKHGVEFNTLTTVNDHNSRQPLEVYRFLKSIGSQVMQFIPVVERKPDGQEATDWSVQAEPFGAFLCTIFDEWVRHDVGQRFVQLFDVTLESFMGLPQSLCFFRDRCGEALALEHNGDLYSCDHFVEPAHRLGNIMEQPMLSLVQSGQQKNFGNAKADTLPGQCRQCEVRFACNGECPKHRIALTEAGEPGLNYLCAGYLRFFRHVGPYMRFMVSQLRARRSPAEVMRYAVWLDGEFARTEADGPCPCDSGRLYARCCARTRNGA
jgi:uncharacterized protein